MTEVAVPAPRAVRADEAFVAFYEASVGTLTGYAFQLVGNADDAADVVQEAYARLLTRWVAVREPRPYLFHVATNLAKALWEARARAARRALTEAESVEAHDVSIWDAVSRLPRRYREVVLLYYYADLPLPDVAAAVRRPPGTVKRQLSEARAHLARALGDAR
jgi:RNA polymerase sigma-70 factor (ECF subfamily)